MLPRLCPRQGESQTQLPAAASAPQTQPVCRAPAHGPLPWPSGWDPSSPRSVFWPLPSSRDTSCMGMSGSMLASTGLVDSQWMLRELKLLNLRPWWS